MKLALAALLAAVSFPGAAEPRLATLHVEKIYCGACAVQIRRALNEVAGVASIAVDVERRTVLVRFDSERAKPEDLAAATAKRGFPAEIRKVEAAR